MRVAVTSVTHRRFLRIISMIYTLILIRGHIRVINVESATVRPLVLELITFIYHVKRERYCKRCDLKFKDGQEFHKHLTGVHRARKKKTSLYCHICGQMSSNLKNHIIRHHSENKKIVCYICNNSTHENIFSMQKHVQRVHKTTPISVSECLVKYNINYDDISQIHQYKNN